MEKPWSYVFEEGGKGLAMLTMATLTMATLTMRHAHYGHAHYGHAHYGHAHYTVRTLLYVRATRTSLRTVRTVRTGYAYQPPYLHKRETLLPPRHWHQPLQVLGWWELSRLNDYLVIQRFMN